MGSRQGTINYGIQNKKSLGDIQKVLAQRGYAPLSQRELSSLKNVPLASDNPLIRLGQNAIGDLGEMASGLTTVGSMAYQEAKKIKRNPQRELGNIATKSKQYATRRGVGGVAEDIANIALSTYNTKVGDFGKLPAQKILSNVTQGAYENPLFALTDLSTLGVGKLIPKQGVAKAIQSSKLPEVVKAIVPTEEMGKVNKIIKAQKLTNEVKTAPVTKAINDIRNTKGVDPKRVARNLIMGERVGSPETIKATEEFARVNTSINKDLHTYFGLSPETTKQEAVSKYILENLDPTREKGLTVDSIKSQMASYYNNQEVPSELKQLMESGNKLYDEGKIRHISEVLRPTGNQTLSLDDLEKGKGFLSQRLYGLTTPEELGDVLFDTYDFLNKQTTKSKSALDSLAEISKTFGRKITPEEAMALTGSEIATSPSVLASKLGKTLHGGSGQQISEVVKRMSGSSLGKDVAQKYSKDLYAIDKNLLKALTNANVSMTPSWSRKLNSLFKSSQLVTPKWITENRIGNTLLNTLEGVTLKDYLDSNRLFGKYYKDIPRQLEQGTSYSGLLGENFAGSRILEAMKNAGLSTVRHAKEGKPFDAFASFNQFFSAPYVGAEASLEKADRWANMVRQAKRYAKEKGLKSDDVIKDIKLNDELFNTLNARVDESLGDYIGRNYYVDPKAYEIASWAMPFWKYPTQSARVLAGQLERNPLRSQAMMVLPAKYGEEKWAQELKENNLNLEELGGVITEKGNRFKPSKIERFTANPLTAPLELGYNLLSGRGYEFANNLSPMFQDFNKAVLFKDRYGRNLTSPKYMNIGDKTIVLDEKGKPTPYMMNNPTAEDRARVITSLLANRFFVPTIQLNRAYMPTASAMEGKTFYQPYDTSILGQIEGSRAIPFLMEGKTMGEGKSGLSELMGSMMGLRTTKAYPERERATHSELRKAYRKHAMEIRMKKGKV